MKTIRANTILLALTTLSIVSISCTHIKHIASSDRGVDSYKASGLSIKQLEGNSIESAPEIIKNWLGDATSDLASKNVTWSLRRSGEDDIVIDVEVTDLEVATNNTDTQDNNNKPDYVYRPLYMHIDDSVREHRFGNYFVNMIHKSAQLWEKNIGKRLFRIRNYSGRTLEGDLAKHDGISNIYYEYLEEEAKNKLGQVINKRLDTDVKSLIFNFKKNKRIIEADIVMNGTRLEENPGCIDEIRPTDLNYLHSLSKEDKCTIAYSMAIMTHELGHVLLLKHITNIYSAMMNPNDPLDILNRIKNFFDKELLHQDDIDAFNEFYNIEED